jgi:hypothetical protein
MGRALDRSALGEFYTGLAIYDAFAINRRLPASVKKLNIGKWGRITMSKRSVLIILATVFGVIGISQAFGQRFTDKCPLVEYGKCGFVHYETGELRRFEVWNSPRMDSTHKPVKRVTKIKRLQPNQAEPPDWCYVETIGTTSGGSPPTTGWIFRRVDRPANNCMRAFRNQ